ncbi:methyltransferase domain-containing protein [Nostocoides sp. F2B08]|uniref:class I SAM-dependent methyltransferase n=1 Tax=Nostocoides sp. F2B08 TaxID=2653936 RepID=UPI001262E889|nr:class I SAM-dependent methyltransferase [Tetrasphaera sp. F2B08]KAB7744668.1 methyltransferase domain-containing protein [Tetrasphaera sp. F2B08]
MTASGDQRTPPPTRWSEVSKGVEAAAAYRRRFSELEEAGADLHGEARFVASVVPPPARVLDAGCGFGRLTRVLTRMGYDAVGVDADKHLIDIARREDPGTEYVNADLTEMDLSQENLSPWGTSTWAGTRGFRVAVLAGNVVPFLAEGTLDTVVRQIAAHLVPGAFMIAGFGLTRADLPDTAHVVPITEYDRALRGAGFSLQQRWGSWERARWSLACDYAVSVHRKG